MTRFLEIYRQKIKNSIEKFQENIKIPIERIDDRRARTIIVTHEMQKTEAAMEEAYHAALLDCEAHIAEIR